MELESVYMLKPKMLHVRRGQLPKTPTSQTIDPSLGWDAALIKSSSPLGSPQPVVPRKAARTSRFFFKLTDEVVAEQKAAHKKVVVEYADAAVVEHSARASKNLPPELASNIDIVRQFFVDNLSPLTLSLVTGADQAREVLKRTLGAEVSPEPFYRFEQMAHQAVLIRLSMFLEKFLALPEGSAGDLLPKPKSQGSPSGHQIPQQSNQQGTPEEGGSNFRSVNKKLQRLIDSMGDKNDSKSSTRIPTISPTNG